MAWDIRNIIRPAAPGMSGAINPLTFIGSGMATGDIGGSLARMGELQMAGQRLAMQQAAATFGMEKARADAERAAKARETMKAIAPGVAKEMFPGSANMQAMLAANPALLNEAVKQRIKQAAAPEYKDVSSLRKEYTRESQPWQESLRAFERIKETQPTGAGDIALLTSYMKVLDPGSTVREGEFATAEQAGGVPDAVRNMYNRLITGERLSEDQRKNFKSQAAAFLESRRQEQEGVQKQYGYVARQRRMDPREAVPDFLGEYAAPNWRESMGFMPPARPSMVPANAPPPAAVDSLMEKYLSVPGS